MEPQREHRSVAHAAHAALRDAWRRRSLAAGWLIADDWHSGAVNVVLTACHDEGTAPAGAEPASACPAGVGLAVIGDDRLAVACAGLGRSRAWAGIGIAETIDDLAALFAVLGAEPASARAEPAGHGRASLSSAPPMRLVCAIAEGWAEESVAQLAQSGCEDPLSGLATLLYLRTRLAEVYREAEQGGTSPAETHRLLVVGLPRRPDP